MAFADLIHEMLYGRAGKPAAQPLEEGVRDKSLVEFLRRTAKYEGKVPPPNNDSWMRVSSLGYLCAREEILAGILGVERSDVITPDEQLTYSIGSGYHFVMQNEFLGPFGVLYGLWKCMNCGKLHGTNAEPIGRPKACNSLKATETEPGKYEVKPCDSTWFIYQEIEVENQEYKLRGHPDGILDLGSGKRIIEFKTVNPDGFKNRVDMTPDAAHVIQVNVYMWMTGLRDREAFIVYQNKGGYGFRAMRVYEVEYDQKLVDDVLSMVTTIRRGIRIGQEVELPPRLTLCDNKATDRAKECPLSKQCFGCGTRLSEAA